MNTSRILITIGALLFGGAQAFSQKTAVDYLNYDYQFLDEDYNMLVSTQEFSALLQKDNLPEQAVVTYSDSLSLVLAAEFQTYSEVREAMYVLQFTWKRVGYHLWMSASEAEVFAVALGQDRHPYLLMSYIYNEEHQEKDILDLIANLKAKLGFETGAKVPVLSRKKLLDETYRYNPQRLEELRKKKVAVHEHECSDPSCGHSH